MSEPKTTHGGKRVGAGRKARFGIPMIQKSIRLPGAWIARLVAEFGSLQKAIETLVEQYLKGKP